MTTDELGRGTDPTEQLFNDLVASIENELKPMTRSIPEGATRFGR